MDRISHYRIVRRIGAGGMGEVWRAVDERLGRDVAIKLLGRRATAERAQRMMREAQAASALNHPSIVTIHDVGEYEGQPYLVMELVDGQRFSDLGRIAPADALPLCAVAADALGAAHARGILHRDIKSDNLMRLPDGRVKVLDFGLAKVASGGSLEISGIRPPVTTASPTARTHDSGTSPAPDARGYAPTIDSSETSIDGHVPTPLPAPISGLLAATVASGPELKRGTPGSHELTRVGDIMGTPAYMAPEQARGEPADARSEVFSLGVVLYELVCGRRPFVAQDIDSMLELVRRADVTPPSIATADPALAPIDPVVARCLARDPADRPADMAAMAALLREAAAPPRRPPRRAWWLGAGAAVLAIAALGAGLLVRRGGPHGAPAAAPIERDQPGAAAAPPAIGDAKRLTLEAECEEFPTISPDGTIAFDAAHGPDYAIEEIDSAGKRRPLTTGGASDIAAAFSPDGTQLAFLRKHPGGPYHAMVGDAELVTPLRDLAIGAMRPAWSPDGRSLWAGDGAHPTRWNLATGQAERTLTLPAGLVLLQPLELRDGSVAALLFAPQSGSFPEGIAVFDRAGQMSWLYRGEVDEVLARAPGDAGIVASLVTATKRELVMVPLAGGAPVPLRAPGVDAHKGLAASQDWSTVVWSDCAEHLDLAVVHGEGNGLRFTPISAVTWADVEPVAVPGTRQLVVISDRSEAVRPWIVDRDDATPARMIVDAEPQQLDVTRDGKTLVYSTSAGELWRTALDGSGAPTKLAALPALDAPQVGRDGKVYFQTEDAVFAVPLAGGTPQRVSAGVAPAPSPAADLLVLARGEPTERTLVVRDLVHGTEHPLGGALPAGLWTHLRFSADGARLAALFGQDEIYVIDVATGHVIDHVTGKSRSFMGEALLGAHGEELLVAENWWRGDVWIARR